MNRIGLGLALGCLIVVLSVHRGWSVGIDCDSTCDLLLHFRHALNLTEKSCEHKCAQLNETLTEYSGCIEGFQYLHEHPVYAEEASFSSTKLGLSVLLFLQSSTQEEIGKFLSSGYLSDTGNYDGCRTIPGMEYCQATLLLESPSAPSDSPLTSFGLCLPATCDITGKIVLAEDETGVTSIGVTCGNQAYEWKAGSIAMTVFIGILLAVIFLATGRDLWKIRSHDLMKREEMIVTAGIGYERLQDAEEDRKEDDDEHDNYHDEAPKEETQDMGVRVWEDVDPPSKCDQILDCFSLVSNFKVFCHTERRGNFHALDGIRFISMSWVIFGHVVVFQLLGAGFANLGKIVPEDGENYYASFHAQVLPAAEYAVDTFFWMSGFLGMYSMLIYMMEHPETRSFKWIPMAYIHRYLRLSIVYGFLILFYVNIFPLLGSGPYWSRIESDISNCKQYWWTNFLYINSIYPDLQNACYQVSWYLSCDMIYFLVLPWIALLYRQSRMVSSLVLVGLFLASVTYSTYVSFDKDMNVSFFAQDGAYYTYYYFYPWTRVPPTIIGVVTAMIWYDRFHSPRVMGHVAMIPIRVARQIFWVSLIVLFACVYSNYFFDQDAQAESTSMNKLYVAWSRPLWSVGLTMLCVVCFDEAGGIVGWFLSLPVFGPLSKLTYCAYLIHPMVIYWTELSRPDRFRFSELEYALQFLGTLLFTMLCSFGVHLLVERPSSRLEKLLLGGFQERPRPKEAGLKI